VSADTDLSEVNRSELRRVGEDTHNAARVGEFAGEEVFGTVGRERRNLSVQREAEK
jgi:hypothetical protein